MSKLQVLALTLIVRRYPLLTISPAIDLAMAVAPPMPSGGLFKVDYRNSVVRLTTLLK